MAIQWLPSGALLDSVLLISTDTAELIALSIIILHYQLLYYTANNYIALPIIILHCQAVPGTVEYSE